MNTLKRRSGFTLIELLTAITIFSIVIAVISTVYVFFIRAERDVATVRKVYAEARDVMDRFTVSIKEGVSDYSIYNGVTFVSSVATVTDCASTAYSVQNGRIAASFLVLLDAARATRTVYCLSSEGVLYVGTGSVSELITPVPLTSDAIHIDALDFLITPTADPSDVANVNDADVQYQPAVTVSMQISGTATQQPLLIPLSTTISSRVYTR